MKASLHPETVSLVIADYQSHSAEREQDKKWWRAEGRPFEVAIERAVRSQMPDGKRYDHQCRIGRTVIERSVASLVRIADQLEAASNFHQLWQLVDDALGPIRGAGELMVYDVADRLRQRLALESPYLVYLHAGTRIGARRIMGGRLPRGDRLAILRRALPGDFRSLDNHELEDVLCHYRDELLLTPDQLTARWRGRSKKSC